MGHNPRALPQSTLHVAHRPWQIARPRRLAAVDPFVRILRMSRAPRPGVLAAAGHAPASPRETVIIVPLRPAFLPWPSPPAARACVTVRPAPSPLPARGPSRVRVPWGPYMHAMRAAARKEGSARGGGGGDSALSCVMHYTCRGSSFGILSTLSLSCRVLGFKVREKRVLQ